MSYVRERVLTMAEDWVVRQQIIKSVRGVEAFGLSVSISCLCLSLQHCHTRKSVPHVTASWIVAVASVISGNLWNRNVLPSPSLSIGTTAGECRGKFPALQTERYADIYHSLDGQRNVENHVRRRAFPVLWMCHGSCTSYKLELCMCHKL